jgi:hypothetical protein
MSFTRPELEEKLEALANSSSFEQMRQSYRLCTTNQWNYEEARVFAKSGQWRPLVRQVSYRPFDRQWTVLDRNILTILRNNVMSQFGRKEPNVGLISSRAVNDLSFAHCFVTDEPVDKIFISSKTSTNAYVFPLFFHDHSIFGQERRPNFSRNFLKSLGDALGLRSGDKDSLPIGLTPYDIFHYLYAVLHSPAYRSRYSELLKIDFPHAPVCGDMALFRALSRLGGDLVDLHLLKASTLGERTSQFIGSMKPMVEKVSWSGDTVWLDKTQSAGFRGVRKVVWDFRIGGYQVCEKWLKDRKGRSLSKDDIAHYQKIVAALAETIRLMKEVDNIIDTHGGWPAAFAATAD